MKKNHNSIKNRVNVSQLVHTFYQSIRKDDMLGPIFNRAIPNEQWPEHLEKLTDFWETNLFGVQAFKGNPKMAHQKVDRENGYEISQLHFERWLKIWFETIDSLFDCDRAMKAKHAAKNMSVGLFMNMLSSR